MNTHPFLSSRWPATAAAALLLVASSSAQTFGSNFAGTYSYTDLGTPPGVPGFLGGINFDPNNPNTLWIGGSANTGAGEIFAVPISRDSTGQIVSFNGSGTSIATAPNLDGGMAFGPNGVLFVTTYSNNRLLQFLPGSTTPDKDLDLGALGVASSTGTCQFVPMGFQGAGRFKIASYNQSGWYDTVLAPDGAGTFDIVSVTPTVNTGGGPEGIVYIPGGNPGFPTDQVLVSEYAAGAVRAYEIDANGDPLVATQRDFLTGLGGAEGAVIDPVTGDFLFSTFGGGDRVLVVHGFTAPGIHCTGTVTSLGCVPRMTWSGSPSASGPNDFNLTCREVVPNVAGLLILSPTPGFTPFGPGVLCFAGQIRRRPVQISTNIGGPPSNCSTYVFTDFLSQTYLAQQGFSVGTTVFCQYVSRDGGFAPPNNLSLSEGLRFTVTP
ncbi:MAG: hypothetical protein R3F49_21380 [Planctomycetota bacterium]